MTTDALETALASAVRLKAPLNRDRLIKQFMESDHQLDHAKIVALNRAGTSAEPRESHRSSAIIEDREMLDELYARITTKLGSIFRSIAQNVAFFENDTGDAIEARLQKIEREIIRIDEQICTQPTNRKSGQ